MRKTSIIGFLMVALVLFGLMNYFVGKRSWDYLFKYIPGINAPFYWSCFILVASSFILARLGSRFLPLEVSRSLTVVGDYYIAVLFYSLLVFLTVDVFRLVDKGVTIIPFQLRNSQYWTVGSGVAIFLLIGATVGYGAWNARQVRTTGYNVGVVKQAGALKQVRLVMVSDIHLGLIVDRPRLKAMVDRINALNPDLVVLAGDTIDDDVKPFVEQGMGAELQRLKPRLGVYAIMGNHEYIGGNASEFASQLERAGVKVLRDQSAKIADSFYLVGREDRSMERFSGSKRKGLHELLKGLDSGMPVIVLDHQPSNLAEPAQEGVDLQLSGHTHVGQMWPIHLITRRIFETDWGYLQKGKLQVIVSSGYGTWGPPVRIGNYPEIVDIRLKFGTR